MKTNLTYKTVLLPANQTLVQAITGSFLFCKSATDVFKVSLDGAEEFDFDQGFLIDIRKESRPQFSKLIFRNPSAADLTVIFYAGNGDMAYYPPVSIISLKVKDSPSYSKGTGESTLAAAATVTFSGLDGTKRRKQIVITNLDPASDLQVLDGSGNVFARALAGLEWTVESDATFTVKNNTGAAINYIVGETFYS